MPYDDDFEFPRIPWGKITMIFFAFVVTGLALDWVFAGQNFFLYKFWAPKQAVVQRQVFEQTPSYVKGMVQELNNMRFDYVKTSDPDAKAALADIIIHRASGFNLNDPDVPADLRSFIERLEREREEAR